MPIILNDIHRVLMEAKEEVYFAGGDTRVFFENISVPEITAISWRMFQNVSPKYGYASHNADTVFFGNRIVQGQLLLNFQETTYMGALLTAVNNSLSGVQLRAPKPPKDMDVEKAAGGSFSYDRLIEAITAGGDWAGLLDGYKTYFWGDYKQQETKQRVSGRGMPKFLGASSISQSRILRDGFTIYVLYGANDLWYNRAMGMARNEPLEGSTRTATVVDSLKSLKPPGQIRVISGVRVTGGPDQEIDVSGTPIQEAYTFLATDMDTIAQL